ncbi:MAG: radical SAM protein [Candidatus Thorarchaeota archaeon]|nr:radical SAM protein [Candidatus Thorarchaeota archaeon]
MNALDNYPFEHHPCWSNTRKKLWERIHLPVARKCNLKCRFCDHEFGANCHLSKPGLATKLFSVDEALAVLANETQRRENLHIAAISGPREPLANPETFQLFSRAREKYERLEFCLSTNGTLLEEKLFNLVQFRVRTVTISMSAFKPSTAERIYEWARFDGKRITGLSMAEEIVNRQIRGIFETVSAGIHVKVNTILIPSINKNEMQGLSKVLADIGVEMQNIIPLVPLDNMSHLRPPTETELKAARRAGSKYLPQFLHCKQCRSDVVGTPGNDSIL